jgi:DNA-binding transcriptional ArsR family regulator
MASVCPVDPPLRPQNCKQLFANISLQFYRGAMERNRVSPDLAGLRALAHPTRMRMLGLLRLDGPATATSLAERLGANTGATSYHLRQLAKHGFVVDDEERGNGRDRWWKAAHTSTWTEDKDFADPDGRDALDAYIQVAVLDQSQAMQAAMEERALLSDAWRHASTFSDWTFTLSPERARDLVERVSAVLVDFDQYDEPGASGSVPFRMQYAGFPVPGRVAPEVPDDPS